MSDPIDIVIPWVDGSDPDWLKVKQEYAPETVSLGSVEHRFRDWGLLRYLFRGIEAFMPWVRTVHFVTWGHLPVWLNTDCEKLNVVKHEDYIPKMYLPTFSSHTIELNFHNIEGLAEQFVYFNDDMYAIKPMEPTDFFVDGLPRDLAALNVHCYALSRPVDLIQIRDLGVINEHFDFKKSIKKNKRKWFRLSNGKALLRTLMLIGCPRFPGFYQTHCPQPLKKGTYETLWRVEHELLDATCRNRIRTQEDVNQWVLREWQIASGEFVPSNKKFSNPFYLDKSNPVNGTRMAADAIAKGKYSVICVNDTIMGDDEFAQCQTLLKEAFEGLLPHASSFEKSGM